MDNFCGRCELITALHKLLETSNVSYDLKQDVVGKFTSNEITFRQVGERLSIPESNMLKFLAVENLDRKIDD